MAKGKNQTEAAQTAASVKETPATIADAVEETTETTGSTATAEVETTETAETSAPEETVAEEVVVGKVKQVKVIAMKDHTCSVSGINYNFTKGEESLLNEDVAMILVNAFVVTKK